MTKLNFIFLIVVLFIFFTLRLPSVLRGDFAFVFDMGRDHIWVRNMVALGKPTLIGPWGSLAGVYFGPAWYYLLAIPYLLTGGDPRGSVILVMLLNALALLIGAYLLKETSGAKTAVIFSLLFALSGHNINITTYPFHANILPLTMVVMLLSLYRLAQGRTRYLWLGALATSLNFHFEPAAAIFTTLSFVIFLLWHKQHLRPPAFIQSLVAFVAPFIPQIVFEFRHQFLQSKSLWLYFQGQNHSLEGELPFFTRLGERISKFSLLFSATSIPSLPLAAALVVLVIFIIVVVKAKHSQAEKVLVNLNFFCLLIPLLGFMFVFPPELKSWYLYGFSLNFLLLTSLVLAQLHFRFKLLNLAVIGGFLVWTGQLHHRLPTLTAFRQPGPETFFSQQQALQAVYKIAGNQPFSLFVYTPPIYDYHYQYLVWFNFRQRTAPLPVEYSYLPRETSYHPHKEKFSAPASVRPRLIFLLVEPEIIPARLNGWLGHFSGLELLDSQILPSGISLQVRRPALQ